MSGPQPIVNPPPGDTGDKQLGRGATAVLGAYFVVVAVALGYLLYLLWQSKPVDDVTKKVDELKLLLIVMIAGALGSYVHAATSFSDFVGNRRLAASWVWWYFLRPFIGVALALVLYFAVRGGLLPMGAEVGSVSLFGIAAISALAGMFSKQATDKLREVFDTFFKTAAGDQRADKLHNVVPKITAIDPKSVRAGGGEVAIIVSGTDFAPNAVARLDGSDRPTEVTSTTQLVAHLAAVDTQAAAIRMLTVFNPPPGGGASSPMPLVVDAGP
jgi:hypothetical protein